MFLDGLIFDLDGTLWDATVSTATAWNIALAEVGSEKRVTADDIRSVAGKPFDECVDILFPGILQQYRDLNTLLDTYEMKYVAMHGGVLYDGVRDGIQNLAQRHQLFIVSNCDTWYLNLFFDQTDLRTKFTGFDCNGMSGIGKEQMLRNLQKNFSMKNLVYVGDTVGDEQSANLAGVPFMHASYGFGTAVHPVQSFRSFTEIVSFFTQ